MLIRTGRVECREVAAEPIGVAQTASLLVPLDEAGQERCAPDRGRRTSALTFASTRSRSSVDQPGMSIPAAALAGSRRAAPRLRSALPRSACAHASATSSAISSARSRAARAGAPARRPQSASAGSPSSHSDSAQVGRGRSRRTSARGARSARPPRDARARAPRCPTRGTGTTLRRKFAAVRACKVAPVCSRSEISSSSVVRTSASSTSRASILESRAPAHGRSPLHRPRIDGAGLRARRAAPRLSPRRPLRVIVNITNPTSQFRSALLVRAERALVGTPIVLVRQPCLADAPVGEPARDLAEDDADVVAGRLEHLLGLVELARVRRRRRSCPASR